MPSIPRIFAPNALYHIYNRGANRMTLFHSGKDYERILSKTREFKERYPIEILAYCLMPNHFHFLVRDNDLQGQNEGPWRSNIPSFFQQLQNAYARYFSILQEKQSGHIFEGKYRSKLVEKDAYFLQICAYIHDNPVRKGLVRKPENWPYSSYIDLIGIRKDEIVTHDTDLSDINHEKIYKEFASSRKGSIMKLSPLLFHSL